MVLSPDAVTDKLEIRLQPGLYSVVLGNEVNNPAVVDEIDAIQHLALHAARIHVRLESEDFHIFHDAFEFLGGGRALGSGIDTVFDQQKAAAFLDMGNAAVERVAFEW